MSKEEIGGYCFEANDILRISPTKKERRRLSFFLIVGPIVYIIIIGWILTLPMQKAPFWVSIVGVAASVLFMISLIYSLTKTYQNFKGIVFEKNMKGVFANGKYFCRAEDIQKVILQPKYDFYQIGTLSVTIGIQVKNKGIPISFEHNPKRVLRMANIVSGFFNCIVEEKKVIHVSLCTKW